MIIWSCHCSALISTTTNETSEVLSSKYIELCCQSDNYGKNIIEDDDGVIHITMCPSIKPDNCLQQVNASCLEIINNYPNSSSGYYDITLHNGSVISVYCDMEGYNCDDTGGWTRIGYINMTEPNATCPNGLQEYYQYYYGYLVCATDFSSDCISTLYSSYECSYSKVCGQARGHSEIPKGFLSYHNDASVDLNGYYVDGLSITRGNPRQHYMDLCWRIQ